MRVMLLSLINGILGQKLTRWKKFWSWRKKKKKKKKKIEDPKFLVHYSWGKISGLQFYPMDSGGSRKYFRKKLVPEILSGKFLVPEILSEKFRVPEMLSEKFLVPEILSKKFLVPEILPEKNLEPEILSENFWSQQCCRKKISKVKITKKLKELKILVNKFL